MKKVAKKVPLLPKSAKKDTLSSDLLSSEPHSDLGTLFGEFSGTHGNTYLKSDPSQDILLIIQTYYHGV